MTQGRDRGDAWDDFDPFDPTASGRPPAKRDRSTNPTDGHSADQPPPSPPDAFDPPSRPRMHPSLEPAGEHVAHSAIGSLLGGVVVWGGIGLALDYWLGTGKILTAAGVVVGALTGFYIVYVRFGRDEKP